MLLIYKVERRRVYKDINLPRVERLRSYKDINLPRKEPTYLPFFAVLEVETSALPRGKATGLQR